MQHSALRSGIRGGLNVALSGEEIGEAFKNAGTNFVVNVMGTYGAREIGRLYGGLNSEGQFDPLNPKIDAFGHKVLHGLLGGAIGAVRGDALGGAIGSVVATTLVDTLKGDPLEVYERAEQKAEELGIIPDSQEFDTLLEEELRPLMDIARIGGALATALANRQIDVGMETATNAVENNCIRLLMQLAKVAKQALKQAPKGIKESGKQLEKKGVREGKRPTTKNESSELDSVTRFEQKHNKKAVRNMTDEEFLQRIANGSNKISSQKGPLMGSKKHKDAEIKLKRYQEWTRERLHLEAERRFLNGERWKPKMEIKGSSRVDVYNKGTKEAYDYKFGDAILSTRQQQNYQRNLPPLSEEVPTTVTVIKPTN